MSDLTDYNPDDFDSKLHTYIQKRRWEDIYERIKLRRRVRIIRNHAKYNENNRPLEIQFSDSFGRLALHYALEMLAPMTVIRQLILGFPRAIQIPTSPFGYTPFHVACQPKDPNSKSSIDGRIDISDNPERLEIVEMIMEKDTSAINIEDTSKSTPLHLILEHNPPIHLIERMLELSSERPVFKHNDEMYYPLHIALEYQASFKVIKKILSTYPDAIKLKTNVGCLPLHIVGTYGCTMKTLCLLVKTYPEALEEISDKLETPLHHIFYGEHYIEKWRCDGGESREGNILNVREMVHLMIKFYYIEKCKTLGRERADDAVRSLLNNKRDENNHSVIECVNQCHAECEIPQDLHDYLNGLSDGTKTVDLSDLNVKNEETSDELNKKRSRDDELNDSTLESEREEPTPTSNKRTKLSELSNNGDENISELSNNEDENISDDGNIGSFDYDSSDDKHPQIKISRSII